MGASEAVGAGTLVLGVPDASTWSTRAGAGASGAEVEVGAGASWAGAPGASGAGGEVFSSSIFVGGGRGDSHM